MALTTDEQNVAAEMMKERVLGLNGAALAAELTKFREAVEDDLRAAIKAFAQARLVQIETNVASRRSEIVEMEATKALYEAALATGVGAVPASP